jgi:hypothetical protein
MVGFNGDFLFNKQFNGFLTKMDDSTSMVSLALRDGVESSGRTVMEYKRDKHGGRERLIEESATMLIWAFGINWMKSLYDWGAKDLLKQIDLPDLDTSLLKAPQAPGKKTGPEAFFELFKSPSAQTLVDKTGQKLSDTTQPFVTKMGKVEAYQKLSDIVAKQGKKYANANMGKFLFATGLPVAAIAFGIPSFNQWYTGKKLEQEQKSKTSPKNSSTTPLETTPTLKAQPASPFTSQASKPARGFTGFQAQAYPPYALPPQAGNAFTASPFGAALKMAQGAKVQFGGNPLADGAAALLQNERMNTLLVDGVISGGRIAKARNWQEKVEIMFREGSIIGFLYFGQRIMQNWMTQGLKGGSELNFDTTRFLHNAYGKTGEQAAFDKDFRDALKNLEKVLGNDVKTFANAQSEKEGYKFWKNLFTQEGHQKIRSAQKEAYQAEQKLVQAIQDYFVDNQVGDSKHNLIFETAKECGWIPTFDGKQTTPKNMSQILKNVGSQFKETFNFMAKSGDDMIQTGTNRYISASTAGKALNITKKIDTEAILSFAKNMNTVIQTNLESKAPEALETLLKRAVNRRGIAWLASNGICTLFLSYILPKAQHYMTYKMTGKNYFPGIQPYSQALPAKAQ